MSIIDASIVEILHMMQKEKRKPCLPGGGRAFMENQPTLTVMDAI